jgi:tetratricopeptide (TPR) repeat protein
MKGAMLVLLASLAFAQSSATLEGTIRDLQGHPLPDAVISLDFENQDPLVTHPDKDGRFHFPKLRAGVYNVSAALAGRAPTTFGPFTLQDNETKRIELTLSAPAAAEFFDEPNFTVAGVTDTINRGGHGSDTVIRSTEAVTKATASLSQQAAAASESSLRDTIKLDPSNAAAHHNLADIEERHGNSLAAVREYQRAADLDPSEAHLFDWGSELLTHRAVEPSKTVFTKGARLFPRSARMLLGLAAAHFANGAYDKAAQRFFEATDLDPADPAPYIFLGKVQNSEITALDGFDERMARFLKLMPANACANYFYAASLWRRSKGLEDRGTATQVEALLEKAVRLDPTLADAHLQLGILHSTLQDFPKAIEDYKRAIDAGTQAEEAHYRLAQAYQRIGEPAKAGQEFEIYKQLAKTSAEQAERERRRIPQFVFDLRTRQ